MILAINSSTLQYGIALVSEKGSLISEYLSPREEKGFTGFMPALNALADSSNILMSDIKAIAVAIGPGSFTGLRVGLSAAKGFACGLDIPIMGISGTEALAFQTAPSSLPVCSMIASRKGEVFYAIFTRDRENRLTRHDDDRSVKIGSICAIVKGPHLFIGSDYATQAEIIRDLLNDSSKLALEEAWCLRASSVGFLGLQRFKSGDFDDIREIVPGYISPPDIRPNPWNNLKNIV